MRKLPRFADGGIVGGAPTAGALLGGNSTSISISAPVTVNANGGDPASNTDLANKTAAALEARIRGVIVDELQQQTRPGNLLAGVGKRAR